MTQIAAANIGFAASISDTLIIRTDMKLTYRLLNLIFFIGLIFCFATCQNNQSQSQPKKEESQITDTVKTITTSQNMYNDLRQLAFKATPEQLQLPKSDPDKVYGVIMDWDLGEGIATLACFQTGDASMYLSSGGGMIGGGGHENVKKEVASFILMAQKYLDKAIKTDTTLLPDKDCVKFYMLTAKGKFVAQETMSNIENETSKWLAFFEEGNKVITELRIATDKAQGLKQ